MGKQQGPTVRHIEIYSISCNKPLMEKNKKKNVCVYLYTHITESLCCTEEVNTLKIKYTSIKKYTLRTTALLLMVPTTDELNNCELALCRENADMYF